METLLYQTNRRLARPPLVVAPAPAQAASVRVWSVPTAPRSPLGRAAYRAGWALHPSLHYTRALWRAGVAAVRQEQPEVIQCGHVYLAPLALLLGRRVRRPYVVYAYGQEVWRGGRTEGLAPLDALLRGQALARAAAVFSLGRFTSDLLGDWGVPVERRRIVPFGADPRPASDPPRGSTLLSVSRLVARKGIDTVIRALPAIAARVPEVQYRVVGAGPSEAAFRQLATAHGVADRVRFLGRLDDDELDDEYRHCVLFVLPARRTPDGELEGLGLVYLEAAAWGRPAVAGTSGGERDAVEDGVTGCLVDGTSPDEVAETVVRLLSDPARLARMGEAARRRVQTSRTWAHAAGAVEQVLAEVAERG